MNESILRILADVVLITHIAFVGFVIFGLVLIVCGGLLGWSWIRNPWFRYAHLAAIGVVVLQSWFEMICPLTTLENVLRERAGEATYGGAFIAHWLRELLYYEAAPWVFTAAYTAFASLVGWSWFAFRPRPLRARSPARERRDE